MNKCILFLFAIFLFANCKKSVKPNDRRTIRISGNCRLSPYLDSLLKEYIKVYKQANAYAIYFKQGGEYNAEMITISQFNNKLKSPHESGAINYFLINDTIPVYLYSGIEDYISCDSPSFSLPKIKNKIN